MGKDKGEIMSPLEEALKCEHKDAKAKDDSKELHLAEIIFPADWKVQKHEYENRGIDMGKKIINIGYDNTDESDEQREAYRIRDYLSLAYTPKNATYRCTYNIRSMRELLEGHRLKVIGMDKEIDGVTKLLSSPLGQIGTKITHASTCNTDTKLTTYIQLKYVDDIEGPVEKMEESIPAKHKEAIDKVLKAIERDPYNFDIVKEGARTLNKLFEVETYDAVQQPMSLEGAKGGGDEGECEGVGEGVGEAEEGEEEEEDEMHKYSPPESPEWGKLGIVPVELTININVKKERSKKSKVTDMGMTFKRPDRICTDKMVFSKRKKKRKRGTILIDVSGSMEPNFNEVLEIAELSQGVKVATYSGGLVIHTGPRCGEHIPPGINGELRVIVDKSKRASFEDMEISYGGNKVDIPSLLWLSKQEEPRIWVSDGGISGKYAVAKGVVKKGKITQVGSIGKILKMLKGEKVNLKRESFYHSF